MGKRGRPPKLLKDGQCDFGHLILSEDDLLPSHHAAMRRLTRQAGFYGRGCKQCRDEVDDVGISRIYYRVAMICGHYTIYLHPPQRGAFSYCERCSDHWQEVTKVDRK